MGDAHELGSAGKLKKITWRTAKSRPALPAALLLLSAACLVPAGARAALSVHQQRGEKTVKIAVAG